MNAVKEICKKEDRIPLTHEALDICRAAGIIPVPSAIVENGTEAESLALAYPRAVKLLSRDASHKSDIGAVILNLENAEKTSAAIEDITLHVGTGADSPAIDGFMVQEMAPAGEEFFIGGRQDPSFGPVVLAGFGGIYIEIFKDRAMRLAPVTEKEAEEMLRELQTFPILEGTRGHGPLDTKALIDVISRVSWLLHSHPEINEIDLNPVIVHRRGKGVSIVDSRIFFKP